MDITLYTTYRVTNREFKFFSIGNEGTFEMRIRITLMDQATRLYNIAFGVWNLSQNDIDDKMIIRNGDTDRILATVGQKALDFLIENPNANIAATGSILPGELALRTRKYQMGIHAHYDYLSTFCNIYGFKAEKINGEVNGDWPDWDGKWVRFEKGTNYDAFLLNLKNDL
ncbi:DUF6934 family protein [Dyadobacter luticola]|uniref:Uncharacterized protein n=1 Tax=Dyadobacter luticola TaxID=1979387 RepID=A0A5R9KXG7_9BACT|nr:hypothetical protein [Dyadobacter luticola]TLV00992.1 hypothetical protein FEN17_16135 [Dyadobacter luticola]